MFCKYPDSIARFYDTIYHRLRDSVDSEYFISEVSKTKGSVLEIGVGTGRLFEHALNAGADIYGIDISDSMLEVLRGKLPAEHQNRVTCQNIADFTLDKKFDLIIAPFRVLMHITEKEDQIKSLNNVYKHLNNGGKFIFDVFVPDLKQLIDGLHDKCDFDGEYEPGKRLRRIVSTTPDHVNQIIMVHFHMEWEEDGTLKHDYWDFPMRFYFRYELEHLVERSLFDKYEIFGDYNGSGLSRDSKEFVVVCHK